jgi:dihydrofolate reductase
MRKLKLQMQLSADSFVCGPNYEMDWLALDWDEELKNYVSALTAPVDCIILGRHLAEGFIDHWTQAASAPNTNSEEMAFTRKMSDTPKVVFTKTIKKSNWKNTTLVPGDLTAEIKRLKSLPGGDLIAYGGSALVSALIHANLIDEYYLFINPTAIGNGKTIFGALENKMPLTLVKGTAFSSGIVGLHYQPRKD